MLSNKNEYSQNYRIALLSRGQMFGDQDVFFDRPYQTTVTCRSNDGELYQITKENFKKIKNLGDWWQKITSKYVTQEYLHHKLMKNQQKMKSESVSKRSKKRSKEEKSINSNVKGSPLLNKYEMDKRQTFKEIVSGFPFAHKQKKLIESIYTTNNKNIITDKDIEMYQQSKIEQLRDKASFMGKRETTFRALIDAQIQISNDKESKINSSVSFDNKQNISVNNENRKSVYISSRISRWIESMIDGEKVNDIYKSKFKFNINNSEQKLWESIEGSPESIGYRQTFINKNRPSFIEYSESKVKGINNFVPKSMNIREYQNTPATEHRSSQITTSFSYWNKHQYSFSVSFKILWLWKLLVKYKNKIIKYENKNRVWTSYKHKRKMQIILA